MEQINGTYNYEQANGLKYFLKSREELRLVLYNKEPSIFIGVNDENILPENCEEISIFDKPKCNCIKVYSFIELDDNFNKLIERLDYIREKFGQKIFSNIRLLPTNALSQHIIDKTKFYTPVENGEREFIIYSIEPKVRKYIPQ